MIKKNIGSDYLVVGHLQGEGAVEKARKLRPAAITLDIMMPHKNGWQVLQELKNTRETQDIPVLILSIVDEKKMGFSLGAAEYMVKPIDKKMLLHKLRNLEKIATFRNILIIDRDGNTLARLGSFLEEEGYTVIRAASNSEAVERIREKEPDLIIFNLMMPASGGIDLIEYLKTDERVKGTPLILLTDRELEEKDTRELNGRIRATLNRWLLSEEELLQELRETTGNLKLDSNGGEPDDK